MAKYTFSKPYSTKVAVGGVVGLRTYSWNAGDVIEAEPFTPKDPTGKYEPQVRSLVNPNPIQGAEMFAYIPLSVLSSGGSVLSSSFWTPQMKAGVGIAAAILIVVVAVKFWK